jgi:hypothetical protein
MNTRYLLRSSSLLLTSICVLFASQPAIASSDTGTLLVGHGTFPCLPIPPGGSSPVYGYDASFGSYSPTGLTGGKTVVLIWDFHVGNCGVNHSNLEINGFSSDPGSSWLTSITCNGVSNPQSSASGYSYSGGAAIWAWSQFFGLSSKVGSNVSCTIVHN